MSEWAADWLRAAELRTQVRGKNLRALVEALEGENVTRVTMTYEGGGDSGEYHYPVFTVLKDGKPADLETKEGYGGTSYQMQPAGEFVCAVRVAISIVSTQWDPKTKARQPASVQQVEMALTKAVYEAMEEAVESEHGGWYNNEGGEGTVVLNVEEKRIEVSHGDYVTETVWNEYTIEADDAGD